jgi:hypothetical protein
MKMNLLTQEQLQEKVFPLYGPGRPDTDANSLAEALRYELSALGITTKRVLIDRVLALLSPVCEVGCELVSEVLDELLSAGDALEGPGGRVASSPLRAVRLQDGDHLLLSTTPSQRLPFSFAQIVAGIPRRVHCPNEKLGDFFAAVQSLGGVSVSIEAWAGLHMSQAADEQFLRGLQHTAEQRAGEAGAAGTSTWNDLERYIPALTQKVQGWRWKKLDKVKEPSLVRSKQSGGYWSFAWAIPETLLRISADEARRAMFALDAQLKAPLLFSTSQEGEFVVLQIDTMLPSAEYRYVSAMSDKSEQERFIRRFTIPQKRWENVKQTLQTRLQVELP